MEQKRRTDSFGKSVASKSNNTGERNAKTIRSEENTREQSDKNINKFNRLVVYDEEEVRKTKYNSEIRGRAGPQCACGSGTPVCLDLLRKVDPVKAGLLR